MSNEIQPTYKVIEGEVITKKTPEQAGRELGEAIANLNKGFRAIADGFKQAAGKQPIVIEAGFDQVFDNEWDDTLGVAFRGFSSDRKRELMHQITMYVGKVGKRVRVTIEVLEDESN